MTELNIQALPGVLERYVNKEFVTLLATDPTTPASQIRDAAIRYARHGSAEVTASIISLYLATQDNSPEVLASATRVMHGALKNAEEQARRDADRFGAHPLEYSSQLPLYDAMRRTCLDYANRAKESAQQLIR